MDDGIGVLGETPEAGQPIGTPAGNGAAVTPEQPKAVTIDDLTALKDGLAKELFDKLNASLQKLTAGQENRVRKEYDRRIGEIEKRYSALGMQMPDSEKARIAHDVAANYSDEPAPQPAPAGKVEVYDAVMADAHAIANEIGVQLQPGDPEYRELNTTSPRKFLQSVEAACKAKAARLELERNRNAGAPGSHAPIAVQGAAAGGDLMSEYTRRKQGLRPGSEDMLQLRQEMIRKGLIDI